MLATEKPITEIWLRLLAVNSLSGETMLNAVRLLQHATNLQQALRSAAFTARQIQQFMAVSEEKIEQSLYWLDQPGHHLICASDPHYPPLLRAIDCYPGAIFVTGDPAVLHNPQLAVVGSRTHSWYGEHWCRQFVQQLVAAGLTITSGLATGIDGIAHRTALAGHGCTVAVLGNGLGTIYPKRHKELAAQIQANGGALVSEFPLDTPPWPANFPRRNRIISGLSLGVLVVEASLRSGSLVTARYALEQGREVFALPGSPGNPGCEGTHWLIKQGATLTDSLADISSQLATSFCSAVLSKPQLAESQQQTPASTVSSCAIPMLVALMSDEINTVDDIAQRSGQPLAQVASQLLELELAGLIAAVPGGYVQLRTLTR